MERRQRLYPVALVAASVLVALAIGEIVLRIVGLGYRRSPHDSHPVLDHVHPRNLVFKTHSPWGYCEEHTVRYDEEGCVANPEAAAVPGADSAATHRVAFMDDSYVAAVELPYADTFIAKRQGTAGEMTVIRNYGVASYSPEERVACFRPTHVFLLLCVNDIRNDEEYLARALNTEDGALLAIPGPNTNVVGRLLRRSYVLRLVRKLQLQMKWRREREQPGEYHVLDGFVEENPQITEASARYVKQLARAVEASGAQFTLMVVPSRHRLRHPEGSRATPSFPTAGGRGRPRSGSPSSISSPRSRLRQSTASTGFWEGTSTSAAKDTRSWPRRSGRRIWFGDLGHSPELTDEVRCRTLGLLFGWDRRATASFLRANCDSFAIRSLRPWPAQKPRCQVAFWQ